MVISTQSMSFIQKGKYALVLVISLAAIASCTWQAVRPVDENTATISAGYGRAFGQIVYVQDGKNLSLGKPGSLGWDTLNIYIQSLQTGQLLDMDIKGDGTFIWPLQAGEYMLLAYKKFAPMTMGSIRTTFSIPQHGQAIYIGDLHINVDKSKYRFTLEDHFADAQKKSGAQLVEAGFEISKSLMKAEAQLGTYIGMWGICAERSGITCNRNFQGVEAIDPPRAEMGYPSVSTLNPLLKWTPSSREGITYDVAIYDSLTLTVNMPGAPRARGALVEYAEGLREPQYQVIDPLKPDRKYDWSVRLRDGDNVSTWSLSSYFAFFIVGWTAGAGQWFGLSTPVK
jgi:hypothetical protein